jgi:hypothetical protein
MSPKMLLDVFVEEFEVVTIRPPSTGPSVAPGYVRVGASVETAVSTSDQRPRSCSEVTLPSQRR